MNRVFKKYATYYDQFYKNKNYEKECLLIDKLLKSYSHHKVKSLLDLGCGTGNHAIPLAQKNYRVTGIDLSGEMLRIAEKKSRVVKSSKSLKFVKGDIKSFSLNEKFDGAIMMFAVLGYQLTNMSIMDTFRTIRNHLKIGGILIFDVWYGNAVLNEGPSTRVTTFRKNKNEVIRIAKGELDLMNNVCKVEYQILEISSDKVINQVDETHLMRYFFPLEISLFAQIAGFKVLKIGRLPDINKIPDDKEWNMLVVAEAI